MLNFVHPMFLGALALLGVPLLLHLLRHPVSVHVRFPSIRFIRKGALPHQGRRRIRDVLLLLLRMLFFLAVIFAFAQPEWQSSSEKAATEVTDKDAVNGVFYLDISASMQGWDKLPKARKQIEEVLQKHQRGRFGFVAGAQDIQTTVSVTNKHTDVEKAIAELPPQPFSGSHREGLRQAINMLEGKSNAQLYVVSDFQKDDWALQSYPSVPEDVSLKFIDVMPDTPQNAGVVQADSRQLPDGKTQVIAHVANYGTNEVTRGVMVDTGKVVDREQITIAAQEKKNVQLVAPQDIPAKGAVKMETDAYPLDDTYKAWLGKSPPVQLLAVVPFNEEPPKETEMLFIDKAFSVEGKYRPSNYEMETASAELFLTTDLSKYDAVLLLGAGGYLRDDDFAKLKGFLEKGGAVLSTPGRAAGRTFLKLREHDIFSLDYEEKRGVAAGEDPIYMNWLNPESVIAETFPDPHDTDLFLFPIRRWLKFGDIADVQVNLKAEGEVPILMSTDVGEAGRFYVCSVAFTPRWSDWPLTNSFLPVLRDLFAPGRLANYEPLRRVDCGEQLSIRTEASGADDAARDPVDTSEPGVYVLNDQPYEVNVPRSESVVQQQSLLALRNRMEPQEESPASTAAVATGGSQSNLSSASEHRKKLWPYFAMAAALLLLIEQIILGTRGKTEATPQS